MRRGRGREIKKSILTGNRLLIIGMILLFGVVSMSDNPAPPGLQMASASNQYGILGRKAPELGLNTWIDGDGKPMDPIEIGDYRGKVIYLSLFQDW